jgi:hypothetical protein
MVRLRRRDGAPGMPYPLRPGSKLSRECKVCGAKPYVSCTQFRSGKVYRPFEQDWDPLNGGYSVPLKRPHKDR